MPNWCYNNVEIGFEPEKEQELRNAIESENEEFFNLLVPRPDIESENWYDWNVSNWGTKWDAKPFDVEWENDSVNFKIETAWAPPIRFYEAIEAKGYSVDAFYLEEGMAFVGHYEDGFDEFYEYGNMSADEMEEQLPAWVDEEYGIISMQRDREAEEQYEIEEDIYVPNQYSDDEKTSWFDVKVKPAYVGMYEVKTKEWPFPHVMDWNGKFWCMAETNSKTQSKVTEWRGLNFDTDVATEDMEKALAELQREFAEMMKDD